MSRLALPSSRTLRVARACAIVAVVAASQTEAIRAATTAPADERPPNLILIMADDLGYETLGANGGTSYRTPELDRLAAQGARFTHCYAQPLCTPTRVQLMTGQYNIRNYINFGIIDPQAVTFGGLLRDAGYRTCIVGKWQLGHDPQLPQRLGFEESCLWQHTRRPPRYANPGLEYQGVERDFTNGEYGPDLVCDYAIDFIRRHRDEPFLVYYPMLLTHGPFQPTPDSPGWDPARRGEQSGRDRRNFGDMVAYMDKLIGRLDRCLDELQLRERTLVLFLGDNGTQAGVPSQMGERTVIGGKGSPNDAGMHVPLVVSWPGTIAPQVRDDLVDTTDFLPTLLDAARVAPPANLPLDGRSLLPALLGRTATPREWIYCWYRPRPLQNPGIREFAFDHQYRLMRSGELYDRVADPNHKRPLAADERSPAAQAAALRLQAALDRYADIEPRTAQ